MSNFSLHPLHHRCIRRFLYKVRCCWLCTVPRRFEAFIGKEQKMPLLLEGGTTQGIIWEPAHRHNENYRGQGFDVCFCVKNRHLHIFCHWNHIPHFWWIQVENTYKSGLWWKCSCSVDWFNYLLLSVSISILYYCFFHDWKCLNMFIDLQ